MLNYSLNELSGLLKSRKISSVELTQSYLKRIDSLNPKINAYITVNPEASLKQAAEADIRLARGQIQPLTGIPIAQKDIFCAKGWKTTCGSKMLSNFVAPYDAHIIECFNNVGAIMLGRTNMDEFAMGSSNETSFFGPVHNPWDLSAVPGGSSGGSAAAVAARMAPAATGTDTGGSIRQPAALCGITGIKPTYGLVSRYGLVAYASSLDQAGPMGRTAEDCAILLNTMAGFDPRDSTSINRPSEDYVQSLSAPLQGLKIGLPKEYFTAGLSAEIAQSIEVACEVLRREGAEIQEISLPNSPVAIPAYYVLASAEASSNLERYDGVRYGYRAKKYKDLVDMYKKTRAQGFGPEVKRRIMIGTYVLSAGYYDAYYIKAQKLRRLIANDFSNAFDKIDVILGPTSPQPAFNLGERSNDPVSMYLSDIYTIAVNLAGLPGLSLPAGFSGNGRPIGMQLIGNYFDEARLLNIAHRYQQVTDWHQREPSL
ncbi:MAG TPA: Asp-tRNA(Asn)/Glu-tRNA(Gln) amidotransferase subunit GatA [Burkholderiales bacterium]|nr:Asp-tRNA(Asn)/Glu-tRNA(Gln) amidotransferase subunit GatA [Burkholderiales bacterium]